MANVVGTLVVEILAKTDQFVASMTGAEAKLAGMSKTSGTLGKDLTKGVTLPIVAIGAAAVASALDVGKGYRIIEQKTGDLNVATDGMGKVFRDVFAKVPESSQTVADVLSMLKIRTGDTGKSLEDLSVQVLNFARITGTDATADVDLITQAFGNWSVATQDQGKDLDFLYGVYTKTGVGVQQLLSEVDKNGPILRAFGLNFQQSTLFVAGLDKAGLPAQKTLMGLQAGLVKLAKDAQDPKALQTLIDKLHLTGSAATEALTALKDPQQALPFLIGQIKNAATSTDALNIASQIFGARGAVTLVDGIRNGTISMDAFKKSTENADGSINKHAFATMTLTQKMDVLKHSAEEALAPLGVELVDALKAAMPTIQTVIKDISKLIEGFTKLPPGVQHAIIGVALFAAAAGPVISTGSKITKTIATILGAFGKVGGVVSKAVGLFSKFGGAGKGVEAAGAAAARAAGDFSSLGGAAGGAGSAAGGLTGGLTSLGGAFGSASVAGGLLATGGLAAVAAGLVVLGVYVDKDIRALQQMSKAAQDNQMAAVGEVQSLEDNTAQINSFVKGSVGYIGALNMRKRLLQDLDVEQVKGINNMKKADDTQNHATKTQLLFDNSLISNRTHMKLGIQAYQEGTAAAAKNADQIAAIKAKMDAGTISYQEGTKAINNLRAGAKMAYDGIFLYATEYAAKIQQKGLGATTKSDTNNMIQLLKSTIPEINAQGNAMLQTLIDAEIKANPKIQAQLQGTMNDLAAKIQAMPAGSLTAGKLGEMIGAEVAANPQIAGAMLEITKSMGLKVSDWDLRGMSAEKMKQLEDSIRASTSPADFQNIVGQLESSWAGLNFPPKSATINVTSGGIAAAMSQSMKTWGGKGHGGGLMPEALRFHTGGEIPAVVLPHEFIMQQSAVQKYGVPMMNSINSSSFQPKGDDGGPIYVTNHFHSVSPEYDAKKAAQLTSLEIGRQVRQRARIT